MRGDAGKAVSQLDQILLEGKADTSEWPLLKLERGLAYHHSGQYQESTKDFEEADAVLEALDYTSAPMSEVAQYLYSDDASIYRPPYFEKGLINLINSMNYLVRSDWSGALVELRRFDVLIDYWRNREEGFEHLTELIRLKHWMGAFTYLARGETGQAELESERGGFRLPIVQATTEQSLYSPLLVIAQAGQVPHREAMRIPIGRALLYLGPGHGLSQTERAQLNTLQAKGLVKWVNFPVLSQPIQVDHVLEINGQKILPTVQVNLGHLAEQDFQKAQTGMMVAAISRLISRTIVGEAGQAVVKKSTKNSLLGLLFGLVAEGAMSAADTPDTRSWSSLPNQISLYWTWIPKGSHQISFKAGDTVWTSEKTIVNSPQTFVLSLSPSSKRGE